MQVLILEQQPGQYDQVVNRLSTHLPGLCIRSVSSSNALSDVLTGLSLQVAIIDQRLGWSDECQVVRTIKDHSPDCIAILLVDAQDEMLAIDALDQGLDLYILRTGELPRRLISVIGTLIKALDRSRSPRIQFDQSKTPVGASVGSVAKCADMETSSVGVFGSHQAFRALFAASPLAIVVMDLDLRVHLWNLAAERMFGWHEIEVLGQMNPIIPNEMVPELEASIARRLQDGSLIGRRFVRHRKDGSVVHVSISTSILTGPDDEPSGIMAVVEDITERVRAEERRRKEMERGTLLLSLYEQAPWLTDRELYDCALNHAVYLTGSSIGFFHLVSQDQKTVTLTTWNSETLKYCTASYDTHYPVEDAGNWVDCVRSGRPVVYNDFPTSPNRKGLPEGHVPLERFMSIPVMEDGCVRVIFGVGNKDADYDDRDVLHIQLVAHELQKIIERRRAENALRESERRFYAVFHNAPLFSGLYRIVRDSDGNFEDGELLDMSPAEGIGLDVDLKDILGKRASELFGADAMAPHLDVARRVTATGKPEQYEYYHPPTGRNYLAVTFLAGDNTYAILSLDITERRMAEEQLGETRNQMERLLSASRTMIYSCEASGSFTATFMSENVTKNTGYDASEFLVPGFWLSRIHPEDVGRVTAALSEISEKIYHRYEYRFLHKDGRWRWMEDESTVVRDACGQISGLVGYWKDVTERKEAEEALVASEAKYRQLHDSLTDAFVAIDMGGLITDHNEVFLKMLGYTSEELRQIAYSDVITEDWNEFASSVIKQVIRDGYSDLCVKEYRRKDSTLFPVELRMVLLRDCSGEPDGMWAIVRDITERKKAEEDLCASNAQLQALSRQLVNAQEAERRSIARELHDEMGATLTGLSIALEVASHQSMEDASRRIEEAKAMTADLMKRVQRMSVDLRALIVDDVGLIPALTEYISTYSSQTGIGVEFRHCCSLTELAPNHRICLFRIAQEALTNIARHAQVTQASVSLSCDCGSVVLCIEDYGRGFDVGKTLRNRSACGLIGMQERVLALGGRFNMVSAKGQGTRVEVELSIGGGKEVL